MPGHSQGSAERLSLIVETQREIAGAGNDLQAVIELVAERSQARRCCAGSTRTRG
jgi:hypothetical protein